MVQALDRVGLDRRPSFLVADSQLALELVRGWGCDDGLVHGVNGNALLPRRLGSLTPARGQGPLSDDLKGAAHHASSHHGGWTTWSCRCRPPADQNLAIAEEAVHHVAVRLGERADAGVVLAHQARIATGRATHGG